MDVWKYEMYFFLLNRISHSFALPQNCEILLLNACMNNSKSPHIPTYTDYSRSLYVLWTV